jgi:hypothetical protein
LYLKSFSGSFKVNSTATIRIASIPHSPEFPIYPEDLGVLRAGPNRTSFVGFLHRQIPPMAAFEEDCRGGVLWCRQESMCQGDFLSGVLPINDLCFAIG